MVLSCRGGLLGRALVTTGVLVAGVSVLPGQAQAAPYAGKVWVTKVDQLRYEAADGKRNGVVVTRSGRTVTVDDKVAIRAGKGCRAVNGDRTRVRCTLKRTPTKITVNLGDRNDRLVNDSDLRLHVWSGTGRDTVTGGPRRDVIQGDQGADRLYGRGGGDSLYGGTGNDRVYGGAGDDFIMGEEGRDRLHGQGGGDALLGGPGADWLSGGPGADDVQGEGGRDTVAD